MPKFGGRTRMISVGGVVLTGLAAVVGVVMFGSPAGAHNADLSGTAACQNDGTFTITYTGHTKNSDKKSTITVTDSKPAGTTITPNGLQDVPGNSEFKLTQSGVSNTAGTASLTVHVVWTDGVKDDASATVNLPNNCQTPPTSATPTAPTFTDGSCSVPASTYVIPDVKGVDYKVGTDTITAGKHDVQPGDAITITAVAQKGYVLKGDTTWSHTFAALPTSCAGAPSSTQPSCTSPNGSYTIPTTDGVTYFVDGKETKAGTYTAKPGSTVKINAFGSDGHALPGTSSWTLKFEAAPTDCTPDLAVTFVDNTCTLSGTYTIPDTVADYTVNDVAVSAGKHSATAGTTITVRAIARAGHPLTGTTSWTHAFATLPQCTPAAPQSGGQLPNTGPDVPVGKAGLVAGLLALLGAAMMFVGRRPRPVTPGRHSAS